MSNPADFKEFLSSRKALANSFLEGQFLPDYGCPTQLAEAIRYSLLAGGKRLRPILVMMACEVAGGNDQTALPAAAAVEMIHTYSLIHDDLPAMDDDDLRRGRPTCHMAYGEALAILAGDALLTRAFELLVESYPPATAATCCRELAKGAGAAGMVGGQAEDLAWEKHGGGLEDLKTVHAHKTGALFRASLRLGVISAHGEKSDGADPVLLKALDAYGGCFGLIFQVTDDLLDVESTAEKTGKRTQKDAAKGKLTFPGIVGIENSKRYAQELALQVEEHLRPLGSSAHRLLALVNYTLARDR